MKSIWLWEHWTVGRNWASTMLLTPLLFGLWCVKILRRVVHFHISRYRELKNTLKDAKMELEEIKERKRRLSIENKQLHVQISMFEDKSRLNLAETESVRKSLNEATAKMSHIMVRENKGGFESPSDPFSPSKIAKKLMKLYEEQALSIVEMFGDEEIKGVEFIANMMQESYNFCKKKAIVQILAFTSAVPEEDNYQDEDENSENETTNLTQFLTDTEINELYLLRWKASTSELLRDQIRKAFTTISTNKLDEKIKFKFQGNASDTILETFLCECADISWLITTCYPPLKMKFDVRDKMYEGCIKSNFRKYTTKRALAMHSYPRGFIVCVVLPALVSVDGSLLHMRGEIITID